MIRCSVALYKGYVQFLDGLDKSLVSPLGDRNLNIILQDQLALIYDPFNMVQVYQVRMMNPTKVIPRQRGFYVLQ